MKQTHTASGLRASTERQTIKSSAKPTPRSKHADGAGRNRPAPSAYIKIVSEGDSTTDDTVVIAQGKLQLTGSQPGRA